MWLATQHGFFSAVWKDGKIHLRARLRKDLENVCRLAWPNDATSILEWPDADYRYRVLLHPGDFSDLCAVLARDVDYSNFKARIYHTADQDEKAPVYGQLWAAMAKLQK